MRTEPYWTACYTLPGAEHKARAGVEGAGFGCFLPTFARTWAREGKMCVREYPLLGRYLFVSLQDESWGQINDIDGVHRVLTNDNKPIRIAEQDMCKLMLAHATRAYDVKQYRNDAGRFIKYQKRRRRPRPGKKLRSFAKLANQVPA